MQIPRRNVATLAVGLVLLGLLVLGTYRSVRKRHAFGGAAVTPCVEIREAGKHVGEQGCVTGLVVGVVISRAGHTFLDFCPDYRQCPFGTVIFAADRSKFGDLETLRGQQVEIRGVITVYRSRPQIIIHDPLQISAAR